MNYCLDRRESGRITCLRAICVVFVIYLHQYAGDIGNATFSASGSLPVNGVMQGIQYVISRIITFSAVPLFFMISSVLLYAKEFTWKSNMRKKLSRLIVPYLLWISLYIFLYFIGQTIPFTSQYFANANRRVRDMELLDFVSAYTGLGGDGIFVNAMWFLRDLIILNMLAPFLKKVIDKFPFFCLVALLVLWNMGNIPAVLILDRQGVVFFALGYYIVKYGWRMNMVDKIPCVELSLLYVLAVGIEYYFHVVNNQMVMAAHSFSVILGILLLIKLTGYICKENQEEKVPLLIQSISEYSFFVYVSHDFIQTMLKKISGKLLSGGDVVQMVTYFILPIVTCTVCVLIAVFLKKRVSVLYRVMTGTRQRH